jgi:hypothetical protein
VGARPQQHLYGRRTDHQFICKGLLSMPVAKRKATELVETVVSWEHLPPMVLELVIALLPHHEDLAHAGQVCQRWRECLRYSGVVWREQLVRQGWTGGDDGQGENPLREAFLQRRHWRTLCYQCCGPCERVLAVGPLKVCGSWHTVSLHKAATRQPCFTHAAGRKP